MRQRRLTGKLLNVLLITLILAGIGEVAVRFVAPRSILTEAILARAFWIITTPDLLGIGRVSRDFMDHNSEGYRSHMPDFSGKVRNPVYDSHKLREVMDFRVTTNSTGFRTHNLDRKREENEFRIVCIGDSWVFGWGVNDGEAFCDVLEDLLQRKVHDRKIKVFNLGVSASDSEEILSVWQQSGIPLQPDVVVFCGMINDAKKAYDNRFDRHPVLEVFIQAMQQSRFALWVKNLVRKDTESTAPVFLSKYAGQISKVFSEISQSGALLMVVDQQIPIPVPGFEDHIYTYGIVAEKNNFPLIRIGDLFQKADVSEKELQHIKTRLNWTADFDDLFKSTAEKDKALPFWYLYQELSHPNETGHRLIGQALAEQIARLSSNLLNESYKPE